MASSNSGALPNAFPHSKPYPCCICGNFPALRKVGRKGYCKKHFSDAEAERAAGIGRAEKANWRNPHPEWSLSDQTLSRAITKSKNQVKK